MNNLNELWKEIGKSLQENKRILGRLNAIDNEYYSFQMDISKLSNILDNKKKDNAKTMMNEKNILVIHQGNPYLTFLLAIEAIQKEVNITIDILK